MHRLHLAALAAGLISIPILIGLPSWAKDVSGWSTAAGSNNDASPDGTPESMAPSGVNDSAREVMAAIRRWIVDRGPYQVSTGSSGVYALAATQTVTAYVTGDTYSFIANHAAAGTATLNIDSTGARNILKQDGQELINGDIRIGQHVTVAYAGSGDVFMMLTPVANTTPNAGLNAIADLATTDNNFIVADGTNWVGEGQALARASLGLSDGIADIAGLATTDSNLIVGNGSTWIAESGATLRTTIGVGTGDNVQFAEATATGSFFATGAFTSLGIDDNATVNAIRISLDEEVTMSSQPCFHGINGGTDADKTGNGATYTIVTDTAAFDQSNAWDNTTFTANIAGRYLFTGQLILSGITTLDDFTVSIITSNRTYSVFYNDTNMTNTFVIVPFSMIADMDAADTMTWTVVASGEASDLADIEGNQRTWIMGCLLV